MEKIEINLKRFSEKEIDIATDEIKKGSVIVLPTDTVYGFSCDATNKRSVERLYVIKKMSRDKTTLVLMKSLGMIEKYCFLNKRQREYIKKSFSEKRPVTVILKSRLNLSEYFVSKSHGVAVRIPKRNEFLMKVLKRSNVPLASTSLNISGEEILDDVEDLKTHFKSHEPDFVVDAGKISNAQSSRIVDIRDMDNIKVIRA